MCDVWYVLIENTWIMCVALTLIIATFYFVPIEGRKLIVDWQHVIKTQGEQNCSSDGFLQEVQGRRVDEALFGDLCEFGLDERSAGKKKEDMRAKL